MQGDEDSSFASPSPVRAPSTPALCITFGLFLKPLVGERGYSFQLQPHMSPIYKELPVLKISPLRAQEIECRHGAGQISPGECRWPGLQEPARLSYLGCCDHPTTSHQGWCIVWPKTHTSGDTPTACAWTHSTLIPPDRLQKIHVSVMLQLVSPLACCWVVCALVLLSCW